MPIYDYKCSDCPKIVELHRSYETRDDKATCACGGTLKREWTTPPKTGRARYECAVVTGKGETIKGNFGGGYRKDSLKVNKRRKGESK